MKQPEWVVEYMSTRGKEERRSRLDEVQAKYRGRGEKFLREIFIHYLNGWPETTKSKLRCGLNIRQVNDLLDCMPAGVVKFEIRKSKILFEKEIPDFFEEWCIKNLGD